MRQTLEFKENVHRTVYEGFIDHLKALKQGAGRLKLAANINIDIFIYNGY